MGWDPAKTVAAVVNPVAFASTAASMGLDYYEGKKGREAQRDANQANINLTREQMAFQERMSSTAHQREVDDLIKAGLNPVMSANQGASSPGGSTADVAPLPPIFRNSAATAREAVRFAQEIKESESRIRLNNAGARRSGADASGLEENLNWTKMMNLIPRKVLDLYRSSPSMEDVIKYNPFSTRGENDKYERGREAQDRDRSNRFHSER